MREPTGGGVAALGVAVASGAIAAASPPAPTGRPVVDAVLVGTAVGLVTLVGAAAPWWAIVGLSAVAVAAGAAAVVVVVAAAALGLSLFLAWRGIDAAAPRAVAAALALNALAWAQLPGFFGLTSIIGIAAALGVLVVGAAAAAPRVRRPALVGAVLVVVVGIVGIAALALAASGARDDLEVGRDASERGIDALEQGDLDGAAAHFEDAAVAFAAGGERVRSPAASLAGFVPVAAQHRAAVVALTDQGAAATRAVAASLREIDPEALRLRDGGIDVDAVGALAGPLRRVGASLDAMRAAIEGTDSPWLVDTVTDELESLEQELTERAPQLADATRAAELAPAILGGDGTRRYLVLFGTPSEARGLGSFVGNYGELEIDDGRITMPRFGRVKDLERIDQEVGTVVSGPDGFLERYATFGYDPEGDGPVGDAAWRNLTATPHFPWVGEIAVEMYEQETGVRLDGVMLADPYVVQALLRYTGPIDLPTLGVRIDGDNAADFLLQGQYEQLTDGAANEERVDALEEAARTTFERALAGELPDAVQLVQDFGPLVEQRRFVMWTTDPAEQELLDRVGLLGAVPPLEGGDGWSFTVNNAGGGKIDAFLRRAASYRAAPGPDGTIDALLRVELTNAAPAAGLPEYVIGNLVGLPPGTNRLYVTFYSPLELATATVDGEAWSLRRSTEVGWNAFAGYVEIPPGGTVAIELRLRGSVADPTRLTTWEQPLASPLDVLD